MTKRKINKFLFPTVIGLNVVLISLSLYLPAERKNNLDEEFKTASKNNKGEVIINKPETSRFSEEYNGEQYNTLVYRDLYTLDKETNNILKKTFQILVNAQEGKDSSIQKPDVETNTLKREELPAKVLELMEL